MEKTIPLYLWLMRFSVHSFTSCDLSLERNLVMNIITYFDFKENNPTNNWTNISTRDFMNLFSYLFPGVNCMVLGSLVHCCFSILREPLNEKFSREKFKINSSTDSVSLYLIKKFYTYVFSVGCIMHWYEIFIYVWLLSKNSKGCFAQKKLQLGNSFQN